MDSRSPYPLRRMEELLRAILDKAPALINLIPVNTVSGPAAELTGAVPGLPVRSLTAAITPVQDLHGYDAPWAPGAGKNLLPYFTIGISINTSTGAESTSTKSSATDYIPVDFSQNSKYTISGMPDNLFNFVAAYNAGKQFLGRTAAGGTVNRTISSTSFTNGSPQVTGDIAYIRVTAYENTTTTGTISEITSVEAQLEIGSSATTYAPYSNVCPITGWTGANIHVSPAQDQDDTVYPVTWQTEAGTVYGGTVNVTTGLLTVTHGVIASYNGETLPGAWLSSMDEYAAGTTPTTGAQVVYELDEPQTYQLTPTEVRTLTEGPTVVRADTGDVSVTYHVHA